MAKKNKVATSVDSKAGYTDALDSEVQIQTEEDIASMVFECVNDVQAGGDYFGEGDAAELGRQIFRHVCTVLRPDLFDKVNEKS